MGRTVFALLFASRWCCCFAIRLLAVRRHFDTSLRSSLHLGKPVYCRFGTMIHCNYQIQSPASSCALKALPFATALVHNRNRSLSGTYIRRKMIHWPCFHCPFYEGNSQTDRQTGLTISSISCNLTMVFCNDDALLLFVLSTLGCQVLLLITLYFQQFFLYSCSMLYLVLSSEYDLYVTVT